MSTGKKGCSPSGIRSQKASKNRHYGGGPVQAPKSAPTTGAGYRIQKTKVPVMTGRNLNLKNRSRLTRLSRARLTQMSLKKTETRRRRRSAAAINLTHGENLNHELFQEVMGGAKTIRPWGRGHEAARAHSRSSKRKLANSR